MHRPVPGAQQRIEVDLRRAPAHVPEVDGPSGERGVRPGRPDAVVVAVIAGIVVGHQHPGGREHRMHVTATQEVLTHARRQLALHLVPEQHRRSQRHLDVVLALARLHPGGRLQRSVQGEGGAGAGLQRRQHEHRPALAVGLQRQARARGIAQRQHLARRICPQRDRHRRAIAIVFAGGDDDGATGGRATRAARAAAGVAAGSVRRARAGAAGGAAGAAATGAPAAGDPGAASAPGLPGARSAAGTAAAAAGVAAPAASFPGVSAAAAAGRARATALTPGQRRDQHHAQRIDSSHISK